jgi:hypothetical protein
MPSYTKGNKSIDNAIDIAKCIANISLIFLSPQNICKGYFEALEN